MLDLLAARPGERLLDLGCGSGELSLVIEKIVSGSEANENKDGKPVNGVRRKGLVIGVDQSTKMVERAHENGFRNSFVADVHDLSALFPPNPATDLHTLISTSDGGPEKEENDSEESWKFDAVFSNAALHWCKRDPQAVVHEAARVLKKGGRFVGEMGGFTNIIGLRSTIHNVLKRRGYANPEALDPWYFPSTETYQGILTRAGLRVAHISLVPRFTPLSPCADGGENGKKGGIVAWQRTFCTGAGMIYGNAGMSEQEMEDVMQEVEDICSVDCRDGEGRWAIMYVRLRFVAFKD